MCLAYTCVFFFIVQINENNLQILNWNYDHVEFRQNLCRNVKTELKNLDEGGMRKRKCRPCVTQVIMIFCAIVAESLSMFTLFCRKIKCTQFCWMYQQNIYQTLLV